MIRFMLDPKSGVPIYRQIQDQIRYGIASGSLRPSEQLPTVRALAVDLAVNPNTVIKAYTELERQGILTTEQGSGTFVAPEPALALSPGDREGKLMALCAEFLAQVARYGFSPDDVLATITRVTTEVQDNERSSRTRGRDRGRTASAAAAGDPNSPADTPGDITPRRGASDSSGRGRRTGNSAAGRGGGIPPAGK